MGLTMYFPIINFLFKQYGTVDNIATVYADIHTLMQKMPVAKHIRAETLHKDAFVEVHLYRENICRTVRERSKQTYMSSSLSISTDLNTRRFCYKTQRRKLNFLLAVLVVKYILITGWTTDNQTQWRAENKYSKQALRSTIYEYQTIITTKIPWPTLRFVNITRQLLDIDGHVHNWCRRSCGVPENWLRWTNHHGLYTNSPGCLQL